MAAPNSLKFGVAMVTQEQRTILGKLGYYISFLAVALPSRSVPTFCELLVASMITAEGFVTQSWFQGRLHNFWGSYHKWLEKAINRLILKKLRKQVQSLPCKAKAIDDHCNHRLSNSDITNTWSHL